MRVCILLSTYNGGRYISELLESLISQSYEDIIICIRDDGSSDNTKEVISEFKVQYSDKVFILEDDLRLGFPDCFWELLAQAPRADYYAFCDQDDIWYPTKIYSAVNLLKRGQHEGTKLYYHSYNICDEDGHIVGSYYPGDIKDNRIVKHFFFTYVLGFSMVINEEMRKLLLSYAPKGKNLAHDVWCILNAYYFGEVYYDIEPRALYRRYEGTVTSAGKGYIPLVRSWIKKEVLGNEMDILRNRLSVFLGYNRDCLPCKDVEELELFSCKGGAKRYFKKLFYRFRIKDTLGGELATRLLFLLNR